MLDEVYVLLLRLRLAGPSLLNESLIDGPFDRLRRVLQFSA